MPPTVNQLLFSDAATNKLGARAISREDCRQLLANGSVLAPNPHAGQPDRRLLIGSTNGGRVLTVVVEPTLDPADWLVVTGWESTERERKMFQRNRV